MKYFPPLHLGIWSIPSLFFLSIFHALSCQILCSSCTEEYVTTWKCHACLQCWACLEYYQSSLNMAKFFSFFKCQWQCGSLQNLSLLLSQGHPTYSSGSSFLCAPLCPLCFLCNFHMVLYLSQLFSKFVSFLKAEPLSLISIPQCQIKYLACCRYSINIRQMKNEWIPIKIICITGLFNFICELHWIESQKNKLIHLSILHVGIVHVHSNKEHSRCKKHYTVHAQGGKTTGFRSIIVFGHSEWENNVS